MFTVGRAVTNIGSIHLLCQLLHKATTTYQKSMPTHYYRTKINIYGLTAITLLAILTYRTTLFWMYDRYIEIDSYYSHGFLVPFVSIFFIYQQRDRLKKVEQETNIVGLCFIILGLLLHLLGTIFYVFSISGFSIFFLVIGLSLYLFGADYL